MHIEIIQTVNYYIVGNPKCWCPSLGFSNLVTSWPLERPQNLDGTNFGVEAINCQPKCIWHSWQTAILQTYLKQTKNTYNLLHSKEIYIKYIIRYQYQCIKELTGYIVLNKFSGWIVLWCSLPTFWQIYCWLYQKLLVFKWRYSALAPFPFYISLWMEPIHKLLWLTAVLIRCPSVLSLPVGFFQFASLVVDFINIDYGNLRVYLTCWIPH